jgi:uncharacterized protein with ParB-like and HNH nuclease domain
MDWKFTPEHKVINDLFGKDMTYVIPDYQRPYSWESVGKSDRNNQVNMMWEDLILFFQEENKKVYFLGSMVLVDNGEREYQVIDGQQRLTTLVLLFVAIKCFLGDLSDLIDNKDKEALEAYLKEAIPSIDDLIYNKKIFGATAVEKKVKIERSIGFDYDAVLKEVMNCKTIASIDLKEATDEQKEVVFRYFSNKDYFVEQLKELFLDKNGQEPLFTLDNAKNLNAFIEFLKNRVSVVRIQTGNFDTAYQIFEILNNRGLPLSNKDLLRNFIIKSFAELKEENPSKYADLEPSQRWLDLDEDLKSDFIGRWVESRRAAQQKYSAFNAIKEYYLKNYKDSISKKAIEIFYEDLKEGLGYYKRFNELNFDNKILRNKVQFLKNAGNNRYTENLYMALFKHFKYDGKDDGITQKIIEFTTTYEKHLLYVYMKPAKRFSNQPIYDAIKDLNRNNFEAAKTKFSLTNNQKEELIKFLNGEVRDNAIGKLLISKNIRIQDAAVEEDLVEQQLNFKKATLEHIIPQKPEQGTNWERDFSDSFKQEYTYRLGNMTLLTQRMNAAAKNYDFERKKKHYKKTKLAMTQSLVQCTMTEDFIKKRHIELVNEILKDLNLEAIL